MKKQTAMALAAVFAMSVAGTALAAPANPFVDVPAKHWAYDSINKLAQAGVISGYGDGTFKGDKTLTRYEVAVLVGKAMANSDKADAEAKKTIEALKAEFGSELSNLGVRVDNLEKNASKIKFTGEVRERFEYIDKNDAADKTMAKTRFRLSMTAPVADNVTFKGRLHAESKWGNENVSDTDKTNNEVRLDQAYITGTVGGVTYSFGRQPIAIGQSLIYDGTQNNDGLVVTAGKDLKVTAGAFKQGAVNYTIGNIATKVNALNLSASYLKDDLDGAANAYDTTSFGFKYTGLKNLAVTAEYGLNDSKKANNKADHLNDAAKAWAGKIKYKGADYKVAKSFGFWTGYRKAEAGFDPAGNNNMLDAATFITGATYEMDDMKGMEYGFEYTLFKNGIFTVQYSDHEDYKGQVDKKNMYAQLVYVF